MDWLAVEGASVAVVQPREPGVRVAGGVLDVAEGDAVVEGECDERRAQSVGGEAGLHSGAVAERSQ